MPFLSVLSTHKKVKACEVTNLSLASLTFRKVWVFYRTRPFENWPQRCVKLYFTLLLKQNTKYLVANLDILFSSSKVSTVVIFTKYS